MQLTRRTSLVGLAGLGFAEAPVRAADEPGLRLRFLFDGAHASVVVNVEGHRPLRFLLDTGTQYTAISQAAAEELGLKKVRTDTVTGVVGMRDVPVYNCKDIAISNALRIPDVEMWGIKDLKYSGYDGLFPLFLLRCALVNFVDRTITVYSTPQQPPPEMMIFRQMEMYGRRRAGGYQSYINCGLGSDTFEALVDTGSTSAFLLNVDRKHRGQMLARYKIQNAQEVIVGVTGGTQTESVLVDDFTIGSNKIRTVPAVLLGDAPASGGLRLLNAAAHDTYGTVGMEVLRRFDIWLDAKADLLGLRPNRFFNDVIRMDRSGLAIGHASKSDDTAVVRALVKGGPGERAGLKEGDKILGFSGGGATMEDLIWNLRGPPGSTVKIKVGRTDHDQTFQIVLEDYPTSQGQDTAR